MTILRSPARPGPDARQPVPKDAQVLRLGGRTVIAREWHYPGQADDCTLCPGCPIRGTGATLCLMAAPGDVPTDAAALHRLPGPRPGLGLVGGGGDGDGRPLAE